MSDQEIRDKLREYAEDEGAETGELCMVLCDLAERTYLDYTLTQLEDALMLEIKEQLSQFEMNHHD